jgi:hypothetical protein
LNRRTLAASALLLPLVPGSAQAAQQVPAIIVGTCKVVDDATGDVQINDLPGTETADDKHIDVDNVYVHHHGKAIDVMITNREMSQTRRGTWLLTFTAGKTTYGVRASLGSWSTPTPTTTFSAGTLARLVPVTGKIDIAAGSITVTAPYSVFGAAGRRGVKWGRFAVDAEEAFAELPTGDVRVRLHDTGSSATTYRAGAMCGFVISPVPTNRPTTHTDA